MEKYTKQELTWLAKLAAHVKAVAPHLQTPNYTITHFYTAQWKCTGAVYWYQLPRNGAILAMRNGSNKRTAYTFNPSGIPAATLERATRQYTKGLHWGVLGALYTFAQSAKLPDAIGRAVYVYSRRINAGAEFNGGYMPLDKATALAALRKVQPATAQRWAHHYANGGSPKALGRTVEQNAALRRTAYARDKR